MDLLCHSSYQCVYGKDILCDVNCYVTFSKKDVQVVHDGKNTKNTRDPPTNLWLLSLKKFTFVFKTKITNFHVLILELNSSKKYEYFGITIDFLITGYVVFTMFD